MEGVKDVEKNLILHILMTALKAMRCSTVVFVDKNSDQSRS